VGQKTRLFFRVNNFATVFLAHPADISSVAKLTGRGRSRRTGCCRASEAVLVAGTYADEVAVSRLQALNVVANGVLVLDHVTTHHTTEVVEIAPLDYKRRSSPRTK